MGNSEEPNTNYTTLSSIPPHCPLSLWWCWPVHSDRKTWWRWIHCYCSRVLDAEVPVRPRDVACAYGVRPAYIRNRIHLPAPGTAASGSYAAPGRRPHSDHAAQRQHPHCVALPHEDNPAWSTWTRDLQCGSRARGCVLLPDWGTCWWFWWWDNGRGQQTKTANKVFSCISLAPSLSLVDSSLYTD